MVMAWGAIYFSNKLQQSAFPTFLKCKLSIKNSIHRLVFHLVYQDIGVGIPPPSCVPLCSYGHKVCPFPYLSVSRPCWLSQAYSFISIVFLAC